MNASLKGFVGIISTHFLMCKIWDVTKEYWVFSPLLHLPPFGIVPFFLKYLNSRDSRDGEKAGICTLKHLYDSDTLKYFAHLVAEFEVNPKWFYHYLQLNTVKISAGSVGSGQDLNC